MPEPPAEINDPVLRAQFETTLFNHLLVRGEHPLYRHQLVVQEMADRSFYPATLALRLYALGRTDARTEDPAAERALEAYAQRGDVTAQCLYVFYWDIKDNPETWRRYLISASDAGVANCMHWRARYIEEKGSRAQLDWIYRSAVKGDLYGQTGMANEYYKGQLMSKDLKSAVCWAMKAKEFDSDWGRGNYQDTLFFYRYELGDPRHPPPDAAFCQTVIETQP